MDHIIPSFIAGVLTVLAPCTVTILPVMLSSSLGERSAWKPLAVALSLGISIFLFTLLLKAGTDYINLDQQLLNGISGLLILFLGLTMAFPVIWDHIQVKLGLYKSETLIHKTQGDKDSFIGAILLGFALGPVFSTCSPTYFYIVGSILPIDFVTGAINLAVYSLGLVVVLLAIGYGGRAVVQKLKFAANPRGWFKRTLGAILVVVGLLFITGLDKSLESFILDVGGGADYFLINLEEAVMQMAETE